MNETNRVAIVTGAARGVGRAALNRLTGQGLMVAALDAPGPDAALGYELSSVADLEAACAAAPGPGTAVPFPADVRERATIEAIVQEVEASWGGLDVALACAGALAGGVPQWELSAEAEDAMLDINLRGVLTLSRATIPAMLRRPEPRSGRFVAVVSAADTMGLPNLAAYCASKAGVAGAIRALAVELGPLGITANGVSPGSTDTVMLKESARLYNLSSAEAFARQQPIGRLLAPDEIAAVAVYLAQPEAGGITGAVVPVDGGLAL